MGKEKKTKTREPAQGGKGRKQSSIRRELMKFICLLVVIPLIVLGVLTSYLNISSTNATLEQTMDQLSSVAAKEVAEALGAVKTVAIETGCVARLTSADATRADRQAVIDQRVASHGYQRGNLVGMNGISVLNGKDYNDREYFQQAKQGNAWVSEPTISKEDGRTAIMVAAPVWQGGVSGSTVAGVVFYVVQENFLNDIVTAIKVSENAGAYMIDKDGTTIAHKNMDNVMNQENTQKDALADPALADLAAIEKAMTEGKSGFGQYTYGGVTKFLSYAPIEGTNGWSIGVNAPVNDFMGSTYQGILMTVILIAAALVIALILARRIAVAIGRPVAQCTERLEKLAQGDLSSPVPQVRSKNETARLAEATATITESVSGIIGDLGQGLGGVAEGNFQVVSKNVELYRGDYASLLTSIRTLTHRQSDTMRQISLSADQVSAGSDQVSAGAQALSQGATEQASSVEELAATINEIATQINGTAQNAGKASSEVAETGRLMGECDEKMRRMVTAMNEISDSSQQIGKIIKTIEDIAFQTNILALNAAVEAARAGAAGKGFAVVADEVRNLASKSSEASKSTAELIEASVASVGRGSQIADDTASTIGEAAGRAKTVETMVNKIADAAKEQASAVEQVSQGIDQISSVVQTNSATSEQSAAASEEMSAQAQMLKELVGQFKLLDEDRTAPAAPAAPPPAVGGPARAAFGSDTMKY